jgi:60 kDa SS-A/Ro ribonucleoprotein
MSNKNLFKSILGKMIPPADTINEAGGRAYRFSPQHALAQYAATGCLNTTYYASAEQQLGTVIALCAQVEPEFLAKTAIFCRERGFMKDMPALLCAMLSVRAPALCAQVFDRVIDDAKMLRNFVQIVRSGAVGRKSLGTRPKKLVLGWLASRDDEAVFRASVGNDPSLADVVRMVHPHPATAERQALYGWLIGRPIDIERLPQPARRFEEYKRARTGELPDVPFQMLTALELGTAEWCEIARRASWQQTRMNLNTFARHGVFDRPGMAELVAAKLRDAEAVARARVFPYQLLAAYVSTDTTVPRIVRDALQDALEHSLANVPAIDGKVFVFPDVSGSMSSPVTGVRRGATTAVRCIDVAALVAAAILRKNPNAEILPFAECVKPVALNARDSVMTNAEQLAALGGGGTNCSAPLELLNKRRAQGDLVVYVSDNQSWLDTHATGTATMREWTAWKKRNKSARLVCIDLQPYGHTQAAEREDVLNVGGFSDQVFEIVKLFARGELEAGHWVRVIEEVQL